MSLLLAVPIGALTAVPVAAATPRTPGSPPSPGRKVTKVHAVTPDRTPLPPITSKNYSAPITRWPTAATAKIAVAAPTGKDAAKTHGVGVPVWTQAVTDVTGTYRGPGFVDVQVHDRATAARLGVSGAVFTVASADVGTTRIGLDYSGFAQAYGGDYASRLRLVQLPSCALTTPEAAACRTAQPLATSNDTVAKTLSAPVALAANASSASASGQMVVLAATADVGGDTGTFAASDLSPSGAWTAGGSTGNFTYSYPIAVPPATTALLPEVGLSYDSSAVDGKTVSTAAQASWVGDGWSTYDSYIEQSFISCKDEPEGTAASSPTPDLCYDGPVLNLSLNGRSSALVFDGTKWKPQSDDGSIVTHVTDGGTGAGTHDDDYWTVTDRNGTTYYFGRNHIPGWSAGRETNSVDTVPVYSAHSDDPCHDTSWCTMASRWNLDYVVDSRGGAMAYFYKQDPNYYGRHEGDTNTVYVRNSHLDHIDYGFTDGNAFGTVPNRIKFNTGDRCLSGTCQPLNTSTKGNWPDVPYDLVCTSGGICPWSPSFFSTVRLTSIVTQQYSTAAGDFLPVDTYTLTQTMPTETGDGTSPTLWLDSITHTGNDKTAGDNVDRAMPSVKFTEIRLANRVVTTDGLPTYYRRRIHYIDTESGSRITVDYGLPTACPTAVTGLDPATNTRSCYPVRWTPKNATNPILDWFNKWAVTKVTATDPTGKALPMTTSYTYLDGAGWHFDDNELVKAKYRTYGQFRGYAKVQIRTGDANNDRQTLTATVYYRGMSKNNNTTVVNLTDNKGGVHEDVDQLAGQPMETTSYKGAGGGIESSTITHYWVSAATATRSRTGTGLDPLTANTIAPVLQVRRQAVTSSGTTSWRYNAVDTTYDTNTASATFALPLRTYAHTIPADPAFDRCTSIGYAPANTTKNLVGLIASSDAVSVACAGYTAGSVVSVPGSINTLTAPTSVSRPDQVIAAGRVFYDDPNFATTFPQTTAPAYGQPTMVQQADGWTGSSYTYQTTLKSTYDSYGRLVDQYDGNNNKTTTSYTTTSIGLTSGVAVTNALNQTTSSTYSTTRGSVLAQTDPNTIVTSRRYDALGRLTGVWLHSRATTAPADVKYTYTFVQHQPNVQDGVVAVTTDTLNESLGYATSTTIYDALLRPRQTQTLSPAGGRLISDIFYDSRGWVSGTYNGWWDAASTPNTALQTAANLSVKVYDQTYYTYDGLGRVIYSQKAKDNAIISTATNVYTGDRVTTVPTGPTLLPSGSASVPSTGAVIRTTITDPIGRTSQVDDYKTLPTLTTPADTFTGTFSLSGGAVTSATYGYDGHSNQNTVIQAGSTWTTEYNLLGQAKSKTDPDAGKSTYKYDANGNLTEAKDSRTSGNTVSYKYDALNRRTAKYVSDLTAQIDNGQTGANQVAKWVYDNSDGDITYTVKYPIGHQTSSTAYWGGSAYTVRVKNINIFGKATGTIITLPPAEGTSLAGDWKTDHTYTTDVGLPDSDIYYAKGGLPAETVQRNYSGTLDLPTTMAGLAGYTQNTTYDANGRISYTIIGSAVNGTSNITYTYDPHTGRLTDRLLKTEQATARTLDQQHYDYDLAGNVTRQISTRLGSTTTSETQCFVYNTVADNLRRLTEAWTATDNCATRPTLANHSMVGDNLGTTSAYWTSWELDDQSNRRKQTKHALTSGSDTTTDYLYNGNNTNQPHTLTSTTGSTTGPTSYTYDTAGNMTGRNAGLGPQTLEWNAAGQLTRNTTVVGATNNITNYIYDADGNLLLQKDPSSTTLYADGQQHTLNTTTNTFTGARYYALPGGGTAVRTGSGTNYSYTLSDPHGTSDLKLDYTTYNPTWRQFTPYGEPRGATVTWIDNRGFLNQPANTNSGLTQLGARNYDPATGRFISLDPIFDGTNLQQLNGYSYAGSNPLTYSDPSGLLMKMPMLGGGCCGSAAGGSGGAGIGIRVPPPRPPVRQIRIKGPESAPGRILNRPPVRSTPGYYTPSGGYIGGPSCMSCQGAASASASAQDAAVTPGGYGGGHAVQAIEDRGGDSGPSHTAGAANGQGKAEPGSIEIIEEKLEPEAQPQAAGGGAGGGSAGGGGGGGCGGGGDWDPDDIYFNIDGGWYGRLRPSGHDNEINHIPAQDSYRNWKHIFGKTGSSGPAIRMAEEHHRQLLSTGSGQINKDYRAQQQFWIDLGYIEVAMEMDFADIRGRFGTLYDGEIQEMLDSLQFNRAYQRYLAHFGASKVIGC
ncbi:RHS repeat-associated core domain-containing protein [Hamadaea sp. NPDC051192]|uniref:RHS repeat-associated core domain-containing protein n=1 Tax=Hamadaea sp. NPDC051192 TaxID=3154940 RepID=UPI0034484526